MLKFIFWSLLAINAILFAYGQGLLGNVNSAEREPSRIANQLNTDRLQLLAAGTASTRQAPAPAAPPVAADPALAAEGPAAAPAPAVLAACTQVGNFAALEARRFVRLLEPLALAPNQLVQQEVQRPEITSYMVMIPPLGSKQAAELKAAELKEQGVSNYFILNETTPTKWAISLGVFKSEAAAQTLLAALVKQGVTGARVAGRTTTTTRTVFRLLNIDPVAKTTLDTIAARFPSVEVGSCR